MQASAPSYLIGIFMQQLLLSLNPDDFHISRNNEWKQLSQTRNVCIKSVIIVDRPCKIYTLQRRRKRIHKARMRETTSSTACGRDVSLYQVSRSCYKWLIRLNPIMTLMFVFSRIFLAHSPDLSSNRCYSLTRDTRATIV